MFEIFTQIISIELGIAFLVIFFCSIVQGYSGFGGGLMIVPIMALLFDPVTGIALATIPVLAGLAIMIPRAIGYVTWREVSILAFSSSIAIFFGQIFLISAQPGGIKIGMGIFIILMATLFLNNWRYTGKRNTGTNIFVGVATGGITGAFGVPGGPLMAMYFLSAPIEPMRQRANILMTGFIGTVVFLGGFIYRDIYTQITAIQSGLLVPSFILGALLGQHLFKVAPAKWFSNVTSILLIAIGLIVIIG